DYLSDHSGSGANRDDAPVASQWCFSIPEWSDSLSECHHAETLSVARRTSGFASAASASRSFSGADEYSSAPAQAFDFRFGLDGADRLRQTRSRRCWLPSVQARPPFVSSAALLRGTNERLLAGRTSSRSCLHWRRRSSTVGSLFCQTSCWRQR